MNSFLSNLAGRPLLAGLCLTFLATPARTQATRRLVPAGSIAVDATSADPFVLGGFEGRTQLLIDRTQLGSLAARPIRRIVFRRDVQTNETLPRGMVGGWIHLLIRASWSPRSPLDPAAEFAANHDPKGSVVVFNGPYRVIDSPQLPKGTRVASLAANVSAHVVLQVPILPAKSGNLCLDISHRVLPARTPPSVWVVDMAAPPAAPAPFFGRSCWRPGKMDGHSAWIDPRAAVGGSLTCATKGPLTPLALLVIGGSTKQWGVVRLPFDLAVLGARGCFLYVSGDLMLPAKLRASPGFPFGEATRELKLPADVKLVGARVHAQWIFYHPGANPLALTTTNGASATLAAVPRGFGVAMVQSLDPASAAGRVQVNRALVLQLATR